MKHAILIVLALELVTTNIVSAQVPTGAITGLVTDSTSARISGASVTITNRETGLKRTVITSDIGNYSAAVLLPGLYEVAAEAPGFTRLAREATVEFGNGGSAMGFSQEAVEEFQVSTVNFDLSTGATASGAVNVATRSGSNQLHGSGFLFFRDHHLSAYPALHRNPFNPDPFFQRKQFGMALGGPIRKDRAFFFGTFERLDQRGVISTEILAPEFAPLSGIFPSPTYVNQLSARTDFQLSKSQLMFVRYSHEGSFAFAPGDGGTYPSTWPRQNEWTDQSILGLTSQLGAGMVNDVRFSYFFVSFAQHPPEAADCPRCLGMGAPSI